MKKWSPGNIRRLIGAVGVGTPGSEVVVEHGRVVQPTEGGDGAVERLVLRVDVGLREGDVGANSRRHQRSELGIFEQQGRGRAVVPAQLLQEPILRKEVDRRVRIRNARRATTGYE